MTTFNDLVGRERRSHVYAFCVDGRGGNPAVVVEPGGRSLSEDWFVDLAWQEGCEVTRVDQAAEGSISLSFFVASGPIAFCGHGLLAALHCASRAGGRARPTRVVVDGRDVSAIIDDDAGLVGFLGDADIRDLGSSAGVTAALDALGLTASGSRVPASGLWFGGHRPKALLELADPELLGAVRLNAQARDDFCVSHGVTGLYAFSRTAAGVRARHFPVHAGEREDLATGNIAPTVAALLAPDGGQVVIDQGGPRCDACRLFVRPHVDGWWVLGECRDVPQAATRSASS